jgi:hypothetical protein
MELRVEKIRRGAQLLLSDGSRLVGEFFLSPDSPLHPGRERVSELLLSEKIFLPFQLQDGGVAFVQKDGIALVQLQEKEVDEELPYLQGFDIRVSLVSGESLTGKVLLDLPRERSRLSDFFNSCKTFFYLEVGDIEYLVNTRFVTTVVPAAVQANRPGRGESETG